jgi:two-component system, sensor histidine kinase and response regulator
MDDTPKIKKPPGASDNPMHLLLLDDHPVHPRLLAKMLIRMGYAVLFARTFEEARHTLSTHKIDMILLDIRMRRQNGLDITEVAGEKEKLTGKHIPLIALSDNVIKAQREKCFETGMDEYLPKPVFQSELARIIERLR